jgi:hypothetical protein
VRPREPFTLYRRKTSRVKSGKPVYVWYFRITDDTGRRSSGKSTRNYVVDLIRTEKIKDGKYTEEKSDWTFRRYAKDWWDWEKCAYIQGKLKRGKQISRSYVDVRRGYFLNHILPYFGNRRLSGITPDDVERWQFALLKKKGRYGIPLSPMTINQVLSTLRIIFKDAVRRGILAKDPTAPIDPLKEERKEKTFLSFEEIKQLFDEQRIEEIWKGNLQHYTINLLACSSGMRQGECIPREGDKASSRLPRWVYPCPAGLLFFPRTNIKSRIDEYRKKRGT